MADDPPLTTPVVRASEARVSDSRDARKAALRDCLVPPITLLKNALKKKVHFLHQLRDIAMGFGVEVWLVFAGVYSSVFLEALEFTTVSTALPTIVNDLEGADKFTWIGAAYTLSTTAFQPLVGTLADVLGRRFCMLASLFLFAAGSALCGAAQNMPMLIAGRTVQGMGAAGIGPLADIIIADLVPLKDRGIYMGILSAVWVVAAAIGPTIGGALAEKVSWRWLFYMNLPLVGLTFIVVFFFMKLKTPTDILQGLSTVDWLGNVIVITGTTVAVIALTWGGVAFPWQSYQVLILLIIGIALIAFFFYYEYRWAKNPSVPFELLNNMSSLSGYLGTLFHGMISIAIVYYLPLYFQASKGLSPLQAGVHMLGVSLPLASVAVLSGTSITVFKKYRIQNYAGWIFSSVGFGLLSLINSESSTSSLVGLQFMAAIGVGILYISATFAILAPLGVKDTARALAFLLFIRTFSYTFGITIGSSVLQNELTHRLPKELLALCSPHQDMAYAAVQIIPKLPAGQQRVFRAHIADSMSVVWKVFTGVACVGFLSCLLMREIPMSDVLDEKQQLETRTVAHRHISNDLESNAIPAASSTRLISHTTT